MKFTSLELEELTQIEGGKFSVDSPEKAYDFCRNLAKSHYENFPVASLLLKQDWRKHIFAVYAFARIADDIADEITEVPIEARISMLDRLEKLLDSENNSQLTNPVLIALKGTMADKQISAEPFKKLLTAYKMDINFKQAETFSDLLDYCKYSAEPIGELVLRITGNYTEKNIVLSDKICSALQLINFWQDLSEDLKNNRIYIPAENLAKHNFDINNFFDRKKTNNFINCLKELYDRTELLLFEGQELVNYLKDFRTKLEIKATVAGGLAILKKIRNLQVNILDKRPKLSKADFFLIFFKSLI